MTFQEQYSNMMLTRLVTWEIVSIFTHKQLFVSIFLVYIQHSRAQQSSINYQAKETVGKWLNPFSADGFYPPVRPDLWPKHNF